MTFLFEQPIDIQPKIKPLQNRVKIWKVVLTHIVNFPLDVSSRLSQTILKSSHILSFYKISQNSPYHPFRCFHSFVD